MNGNDYRLALLDTNALSEFTRQPSSLRRFLSWSAVPPMYVPCFSLFSLLEMRHRVDVYERFREVFRVLPSIMLKSHEQLLDEEVRAYHDRSVIDPTLLGFSMLGGEGMDLDRVLDVAFENQFVRGREKYWNDGRQDIADGIASLVANFPPDEEMYRPSDVRHFIEEAGFSQIVIRQVDFAREVVEERGRLIDISAFPSVKSTAYAVWHKFYADRNRKWMASDAFDIIIAAAVPYVDAVITEGHLAESLRKTRRLDAFIEHLEIHTLRDFRDPAA